MDTREQLLAQTFDRHLCVTANAGSGKTRVLVNRYLNLILSGVSPKKITAITFTRKAASEMLKKAAGRIDDMILKAAGKTQLRDLKTVREQLTNARISTIHSFCSSLLRDYPIEAGVVPGFSELSPSDSIRINRDSVLTVLEDRLSSNNSDIVNGIRNLFALTGRQGLYDFILDILANREIFDDLKSLYSSGFEIYYSNRNKQIYDIFYPKIKKIIEVSNIVLSLELNEKDMPKTKKVFFNDSRNLLKKIDNDFRIITNEEDFSKFMLLVKDTADFSTAFFTKSKTLDKKNCRFLKELENSYIVNEVQELASDFLLAEEFAESFEYDENESDHFNNAKKLFELALAAEELAEEEKEFTGRINYDDMLLKTARLIKNPYVRQKIRGRMKYLLVDEFQDTNKLQYDIIKHISGIFETEEFFTEPVNLFIVGDGKQSIYGFRNADVRVFEQALSDIKMLNSNHIEANTLEEKFKPPENFSKEDKKRLKTKNKREILGDIKLSASFRMKPVPAAFINAMCREIMQKESEYDVEYDELVCARDNENFFEKEKDIYDFCDDKSGGSVSFLVSVKDKDNSSDAFISEEQLIAGYIIKFINENPEYEYQDIGILSRTSDFEKLAYVLLKYNIPFIRHSGSGFFNSQEIRDLTSYLKFLQNPADDLALVSILRSPFFDLNESEIYIISRHKRGLHFWDKMKHFAANSEKNNFSTNFYRALRLLGQALSLASGMTVPALLNEILEKTAYYAFAASSPRRSQIHANIEKLKIIARDFEDRGFKNLYDFVEEMKLMESSQVKEPEAAILTGENAVNLMTIHASKGLEFPIAVLYNIGKKSGGRRGRNLIASETGITYKYNIGSASGGPDHFVTTPVHCLAKKRAELLEKAEEKRVFYVALTRAKDHLVLSSSVKFNSNDEIVSPGGFLKMLLKKTGLPMDASEDNSSSLTFTENLSLLREPQQKTAQIRFNVDIIKSLEEQEKLISEKIIEGLPKIFGGSIEPYIEKEFYSPSRVMLYEKNARAYLEKYILGFNKEYISENESGTGYSGNLSGKYNQDAAMTEGNIIHAVLEKINFWMINGKKDDEKFAQTVEKELELSTQDSKLYLSGNRIKEEIENVLASSLFNKYRTGLSNAKTEMTLTMPFGKDFLNGKIDMLIKDPEGRSEIWDWKTNIVDSARKFDELAQYYLPQMLFYAYMLMHLEPEHKEYKARLLFTRLAKKSASDDEWTKLFIWKKDELSDYGDYLKKKIPQIERLSFELL